MCDKIQSTVASASCCLSELLKYSIKSIFSMSRTMSLKVYLKVYVKAFLNI